MKDVLEADREEIAQSALDKADQLIIYASEGREKQGYEEMVDIYLELEQLSQTLEFVENSAQMREDRDYVDDYDRSHLGTVPDYEAVSDRVEEALQTTRQYLSKEVIGQDQIDEELEETVRNHLGA